MGKKAATKFAKTVMIPKAKKMRTVAEAVALMPHVGTYNGILTFLAMVDDKAVEGYKLTRPRIIGNKLVTVDMIFPDVTLTFDSYYRVRVDDKYLIGLYHPKEWNELMPKRFRVIKPVYLKERRAFDDAEDVYFTYVADVYTQRMIRQCLSGLEFVQEYEDPETGYPLEVSTELKMLELDMELPTRKGKATYANGYINADLKMEPELVSEYISLQFQNAHDYMYPDFVSLYVEFINKDIVSLGLKDPLDKMSNEARDIIIEALEEPAWDEIERELEPDYEGESDWYWPL